jgi:hypothetical protein
MTLSIAITQQTRHKVTKYRAQVIDMSLPVNVVGSIVAVGDDYMNRDTAIREGEKMLAACMGNVAMPSHLLER